MTTSDEEPTMQSTATSEFADALDDRNRRLVLHAIQDTPDPVSIDELVTRLVAFRDSALPGDDTTVADIRTRLHHVHLPKLGAVGLVEYDEATETVEQSASDDVSDAVDSVGQRADSIDDFDGARTD